MKRRLSVAIALIGHPKVVYLDEPSTGSNPFLTTPCPVLAPSVTLGCKVPSTHICLAMCLIGICVDHLLMLIVTHGAAHQI